MEKKAKMKFNVVEGIKTQLVVELFVNGASKGSVVFGYSSKKGGTTTYLMRDGKVESKMKKDFVKGLEDWGLANIEELKRNVWSLKSINGTTKKTQQKTQPASNTPAPCNCKKDIDALKKQVAELQSLVSSLSKELSTMKEEQQPVTTPQPEVQDDAIHSDDTGVYGEVGETITTDTGNDLDWCIVCDKSTLSSNIDPHYGTCKECTKTTEALDKKLNGTSIKEHYQPEQPKEQDDVQDDAVVGVGICRSCKSVGVELVTEFHCKNCEHASRK